MLLLKRGLEDSSRHAPFQIEAFHLLLQGGFQCFRTFTQYRIPYGFQQLPSRHPIQFRRFKRKAATVFAVLLKEAEHPFGGRLQRTLQEHPELTKRKGQHLGNWRGFDLRPLRLNCTANRSLFQRLFGNHRSWILPLKLFAGPKRVGLLKCLRVIVWERCSSFGGPGILKNRKVFRVVSFEWVSGFLKFLGEVAVVQHLLERLDHGGRLEDCPSEFVAADIAEDQSLLRGNEGFEEHVAVALRRGHIPQTALAVEAFADGMFQRNADGAQVKVVLLGV